MRIDPDGPRRYFRANAVISQRTTEVKGKKIGIITTAGQVFDGGYLTLVRHLASQPGGRVWKSNKGFKFGS